MPAPQKTIADFRVTAAGSRFPETDSHILALANGQFDIAWTQDRTADNFWDTDVRIERLNADLNGAILARSGAGGPYDRAEADASMATLGAFQVVAFTDRGSPGTPGSIRLSFYDEAALNAPYFAGKSVVVDSGGDAIHPQVAALTNGNLAVVYYDDIAHSVKARVFDPALDAFTGESVTVSTWNTISGGPDLGLTALSGGNFAVTWRDGYGSARLRVLDGQGNLMSSDIYLFSGVGMTAVTELAGGNLAMAIGSGGHIVLKVFDVDGSHAGAPVQLSNTIVGVGTADLAMTALDDGRVMIVWAQGGEIRGSVMKADGTADGGVFVVASGADPLSRPDIETLADGRVVVSYDKAGTSGGIFASVFDPREAAIDLIGTDAADQFVGTGFDDRFNLGSGNDWVTAGAGNDWIFGGQGADTMIGGAGNDYYYVDNVKDIVTEKSGGGVDTVRSTVSYTLSDNVEKLVLAGSAAKGIGNALANTLTGTAGNNLLDGLGDADRMAGLAGNDTYFVDNAGDVVVEKPGEGTDTVFSSISYSLTANVEKLTLTGAAAIDATGNDLHNVLTGNSGANRLIGGGGADTLTGGLGDDVYFAADSSDTIIETKGGGFDTVIVLSNYALNAGAAVELITNVYVGNRVAIDLTGNEFGQEIQGSAGTNVLDGKGGNDVLTGGAGRDFFVFSTALGVSNVDRLADFSPSDDTIQLGRAVFTALSIGAVSVDAFKDIADGPKDANDRIIYNSATGILYYDADGSGSAYGNVKFAVLTGGPELTAADFVVI
ncbi:calcium-binding protein [Mesorhizobium sp. CN2-181]|uniref:calcium-binding protein n=1 Tax=Mesorhizobium yinganensis TaxID=3157707 RepID=UPI0032B7A298